MADTTNICGSCTACCTHLAVETIAKPAGVACKHLCQELHGIGCAIYSERPNQCRSYGCIWYADQLAQLGLFRAAERPDKLGVIFTTSSASSEFEREEKMALGILVEVRPNAVHEGNARKAIDRLARNSLLVLLRGDKERKVIGPADKVGKVVSFLKRKGVKL